MKHLQLYLEYHNTKLKCKLFYALHQIRMKIKETQKNLTNLMQHEIMCINSKHLHFLTKGNTHYATW